VCWLASVVVGASSVMLLWLVTVGGGCRWFFDAHYRNALVLEVVSFGFVMVGFSASMAAHRLVLLCGVVFCCRVMFVAFRWLFGVRGVALGVWFAFVGVWWCTFTLCLLIQDSCDCFFERFCVLW
jgi:hypothetical protein